MSFCDEEGLKLSFCGNKILSLFFFYYFYFTENTGGISSAIKKINVYYVNNCFANITEIISEKKKKRLVLQ